MTKEQVESEAIWIQESLEAVLDRHAPRKVAHARSKRWWTNDIKQSRQLFDGTRRAYKRGTVSFDDYRSVRNNYHYLIRKTKRLAWERFLEGVFPTDGQSELASDPEGCWRSPRYTNHQAPSHTSVIIVGGVDGRRDKIVATAVGKEEIFMMHAFAPQAAVEEQILSPDSVDDMSLKSLSTASVL